MKTFLTLILGLVLFHTTPVLAEGVEKPAPQTSESDITNSAARSDNDDC